MSKPESMSGGSVQPLNFEGRVAVVTGAGGGIGRADALALAARGAKVVVNDRGVTLDGVGLTSSPGGAVVDEINSAGGEAVLSVEDITDEDQAAAIVRMAIERFGRIDIVINNAGIFHYADVQGVSLDRFKSMLDVHVLGPFLVTRAAWPHMMKQQYGRILLTCSSAGLFGIGAGVHYGAAKSAILGLMRSLSLEGAGNGIQVNAIAPGASTRSSQDALSGPFLEWFSTYFTPESVAAAATWLVHEDCGDTGQLYAVQGGRVSRVVIGEAPGHFAIGITPEDLRDHAADLASGEGFVELDGMEAELALTVGRLVAAGAPEPPPMGEFELKQDPKDAAS